MPLTNSSWKVFWFNVNTCRNQTSPVHTVLVHWFGKDNAIRIGILASLFAVLIRILWIPRPVPFCSSASPAPSPFGSPSTCTLELRFEFSKALINSALRSSTEEFNRWKRSAPMFCICMPFRSSSLLLAREVYARCCEINKNYGFLNIRFHRPSPLTRVLSSFSVALYSFFGCSNELLEWSEKGLAKVILKVFIKSWLHEPLYFLSLAAV